MGDGLRVDYPAGLVWRSVVIMGLLGQFIPGPIRRRILDLRPRLDALEAAVRSLDAVVDALILSPTYRPSEDVGFNGQVRRKELFRDILSVVPIEVIVETGTWLGNTAAYMAETSGLPVYSGETNPRYHGVAKMRLSSLGGITLRLRDSRVFIRELTDELAGRCVFFYLDAHWYDDVLAEEFDLIAEHWARYVVMIDDFVVPHDPGYEYDTYAAGRPLGIDIFRPFLASRDIATFYPAAPSSSETGRRRGCVVLASGSVARSLDALPSLIRG